MITMDREWLSQKILIILFNFYFFLFTLCGNHTF